MHRRWEEDILRCSTHAGYHDVIDVVDRVADTGVLGLLHVGEIDRAGTGTYSMFSRIEPNLMASKIWGSFSLVRSTHLA